MARGAVAAPDALVPPHRACGRRRLQCAWEETLAAQRAAAALCSVKRRAAALAALIAWHGAAQDICRRRCTQALLQRELVGWQASSDAGQSGGDCGGRRPHSAGPVAAPMQGPCSGMLLGVSCSRFLRLARRDGERRAHAVGLRRLLAALHTWREATFSGYVSCMGRADSPTPCRRRPPGRPPRPGERRGDHGKLVAQVLANQWRRGLMQTMLRLWRLQCSQSQRIRKLQAARGDAKLWQGLRAVLAAWRTVGKAVRSVQGLVAPRGCFGAEASQCEAGEEAKPFQAAHCAFLAWRLLTLSSLLQYVLGQCQVHAGDADAIRTQLHDVVRSHQKHASTLLMRLGGLVETALIQRAFLHWNAIVCMQRLLVEASVQLERTRQASHKVSEKVEEVRRGMLVLLMVTAWSAQAKARIYDPRAEALQLQMQGLVARERTLSRQVTLCLVGGRATLLAQCTILWWRNAATQLRLASERNNAAAQGRRSVQQAAKHVIQRQVEGFAGGVFRQWFIQTRQAVERRKRKLAVHQVASAILDVLVSTLLLSTFATWLSVLSIGRSSSVAHQRRRQAGCSSSVADLRCAHRWSMWFARRLVSITWVTWRKMASMRCAQVFDSRGNHVHKNTFRRSTLTFRFLAELDQHRLNASIFAWRQTVVWGQVVREITSLRAKIAQAIAQRKLIAQTAAIMLEKKYVKGFGHMLLRLWYAVAAQNLQAQEVLKGCGDMRQQMLQRIAATLADARHAWLMCLAMRAWLEQVPVTHACGCAPTGPAEAPTGLGGHAVRRPEEARQCACSAAVHLLDGQQRALTQGPPAQSGNSWPTARQQPWRKQRDEWAEAAAEARWGAFAKLMSRRLLGEKLVMLVAVVFSDWLRLRDSAKLGRRGRVLRAVERFHNDCCHGVAQLCLLLWRQALQAELVRRSGIAQLLEAQNIINQSNEWLFTLQKERGELRQHILLSDDRCDLLTEKLRKDMRMKEGLGVELRNAHGQFRESLSSSMVDTASSCAGCGPGSEAAASAGRVCFLSNRERGVRSLSIDFYRERGLSSLSSTLSTQDLATPQRDSGTTLSPATHSSPRGSLAEARAARRVASWSACSNAADLRRELLAGRPGL